MMTRSSILRLLALALACAGTTGGAAPRDDAIRSATKGLVDQNGRPVAPTRFDDRFVLVNFIFTSCGSTCPIQTAELARFERSLPPAVRAKLSLLSISVDPTHDTPKKLQTYAQAFGAQPRRWTFATGTPMEIARITRDFAAFRPGADATAFHTSEVRLFDRRHRMIQRYNGAPLAAQQLRADLLALASARS